MAVKVYQLGFVRLKTSDVRKPSKRWKLNGWCDLAHANQPITGWLIFDMPHIRAGGRGTAR
eukprot:scaffold356032_cov37-Prasinocladus_malaysianus.AAC.1